MFTLEVVGLTYKIKSPEGNLIVTQPIDPSTGDPFETAEACLAHGEEVLNKYNAIFISPEDPEPGSPEA